VACFGLMVAFGGRGVSAATSCYPNIGDRQGSCLQFGNGAPLQTHPMSVCPSGSELCDAGGMAVANITGAAVHVPVYPVSGAANELFSQEVSAEVVVRIDDGRVFEGARKEVTLMGNMLSGDGLQGVASGWRIACFQSRCCFQAHIGNKWRVGSSNDPLNRKLAPKREVCTSPMSVKPGVWYHVAATYSAATGTAKVFLDGFKHAEAVFPSSGDLATGTSNTQEINYDYMFRQNPWWAPSPDPPCARGSSPAAVCSKMGLFRVGGQVGVDHNGDGIAGAETTYFNGMMDEVRVWRAALTEQLVEDISFEIVERTGASCDLVRLASTNDLSNLVVHVHSPNMGAIGNVTAFDNEVAAANGPSMFQALNMSHVNVYVLAEEYIDRPVMAVPDWMTSVGVLADVAANGVSKQRFIVDQNSLMILDLRVRDPNYDDEVWIDQTFPLRWNYSAPGADEECFEINGKPFTLACNSLDPVGWSAFSGLQSANYQGPGGLSTGAGQRPYRVNVDLEMLWCVDTANSPDSTVFPGLSTYVPAYTTTSSAVTYRIVWMPRKDLEWWIPDGGLGLHLGYKNSRFGADSAVYGASEGVFTQGVLEFVIDAEVSPEWLDPETYPRTLASDEGISGNSLSRLEEDTVNAPTPDHVYATTVGVAMNFSVRARDRNVEDSIEIKVRPAYGLPAGLSTGAVYLSETIRVQSSDKSGACFTNTSTLNPPMNYERRFGWLPTYEDMGVVQKVCFYAESTSVESGVNPASPDALARSSLADRCVTLKVVAPQPVFVAPVGGAIMPAEHTFVARVGCPALIEFGVEDHSILNAQADTASNPYMLRVRASEQGSRMCTGGGCSSLPGGMPLGATLEEVQVNGSRSDYKLMWTPERGQEMDASYRICLTASDPAFVVNETLCYGIKVRKCQYCLQPGQTMHSVAAALQIDFLELFLANPTLRRPDHLLPYTVLTTGALYDVREGDYLELLEEKFLVSRDAILNANPDIVASDNFTIAASSQMCIVTPTCRVRCKFGTECALVSK